MLMCYITHEFESYKIYTLTISMTKNTSH